MPYRGPTAMLCAAPARSREIHTSGGCAFFTVLHDEDFRWSIAVLLCRRGAGLCRPCAAAATSIAVASVELPCCCCQGGTVGRKESWPGCGHEDGMGRRCSLQQGANKHARVQARSQCRAGDGKTASGRPKCVIMNHDERGINRQPSQVVGIYCTW